MLKISTKTHWHSTAMLAALECWLFACWHLLISTQSSTEADGMTVVDVVLQFGEGNELQMWSLTLLDKRAVLHFAWEHNTQSHFGASSSLWGKKCPSCKSLVIMLRTLFKVKVRFRLGWCQAGGLWGLVSTKWIHCNAPRRRENTTLHVLFRNC